MDGSKLFSNDQISLGVAWAQGGRSYMQDAFSLCLTTVVRDKEVNYLGVFDGHGPNGENVSRFVAFNLCEYVLGHYESSAQGKGLPESIEVGSLKLDQELRETESMKNEKGVAFFASHRMILLLRYKLFPLLRSRCSVLALSDPLDLSLLQLLPIDKNRAYYWRRRGSTPRHLFASPSSEGTE